MASVNKDLQTGLSEETLDRETFVSQLESSSSVEEDKSSGISTWEGKQETFGKGKPNQCKTGENTRLSSGLVNESLTEDDATEICKLFGRDWQSLGRELKFPKTTLDDISDDKSNHTNKDKAHALLIKFIQQHGSDATKGCLAKALIKIDRRDIAENLIGNEHFTSKTSHEQMFFLKEERSFKIPEENGQDVRFCRNIQNGKLYLVRELTGTEYEESCKALKQEDAIADSTLNSLDVHDIAEEERQKKENQKFKEAQDKITKLLKRFQELTNRIQNQKRNVLSQLHEEKTSLAEMQMLGTGLLQLTGIVSHLKDQIPLQAQMYSFSLGLCAILKDLEERVKVLRGMAPSGETQRFEKVLNQCRNLTKQVQMNENRFLKRSQEDTLEGQLRPRISARPLLPKQERVGIRYPGVRIVRHKRAN
ncbi:uncharacterized protein LOC116287675 [Actinia tenebrosa]|uniref:Uncharacterized protein LOC116287675 n=1 Tax=Actinia tenebrosa TaxID=6105 RepID=A0A6P8H1E6_ACTTE|nr:uncharacterized protein LOC116287675 [Actinia tenebrosa]